MCMEKIDQNNYLGCIEFAFDGCTVSLQNLRRNLLKLVVGLWKNRSYHTILASCNRQACSLWKKWGNFIHLVITFCLQILFTVRCKMAATFSKKSRVIWNLEYLPLSWYQFVWCLVESFFLHSLQKSFSDIAYWAQNGKRTFGIFAIYHCNFLKENFIQYFSEMKCILFLFALNYIVFICSQFKQ